MGEKRQFESSVDRPSRVYRGVGYLSYWIGTDRDRGDWNVDGEQQRVVLTAQPNMIGAGRLDYRISDRQPASLLP